MALQLFFSAAEHVSSHLLLFVLRCQFYLEKSIKTTYPSKDSLGFGQIKVLPLLDFSEALAQLSATHILKLFTSLALVHFSSLLLHLPF